MGVHRLNRSTGWPLAVRIRGIVRQPRATFAALAAAPRSLDVLAVAWIAACAATALVLETDTGELALLDQLERSLSAFDGRVDETQYAVLLQMSGRGTAYALMTSLAAGPLLAVGVSTALIAWGLTRREPPNRPTFWQVLAVASHASVILALRQVVAAPLTYTRETMASPLTLNLFVALPDGGSALARFAAMIDVFVIWWIVVLAIGVSVLYRRSVPRVATALTGAYVLLAALVALMTAMVGGGA